MTFQNLTSRKEDYRKILLKLVNNARSLIGFIESVTLYKPDDLHHFIEFGEEMKKVDENDFSFWRKQVLQKRDVK